MSERNILLQEQRKEDRGWHMAAQAEYIAFLTELLDRVTPYLDVHNMGFTDEDRKRGAELREKIIEA